MEIKSKKKAKEDEKIAEVNNSFNNNIKHVSNNDELKQILLKEDENDPIKMEENNIVNDKVDSRCCIM